MNIFWQGINEISVLILIGCMFLCLIYFRKLINESFLLKFTLVSLRLISFILLIVLLSNPLIKWNENKNIIPKVNLILDQSSSMANSYDDLKTIFNSLDSISKLNEFKVSYFTHEGIPLSNLEIPNIEKTDFTNLSKFLKNKNLDNNILISDGNVNSGINLISLSDNINSPLNIIGIGYEYDDKDIEIKNLDYQKYHIEGDKFQLRFSIYSNLFYKNEVTILVENHTGIIYKENILLPAGLINKDYSVLIEGNKLQDNNKISISSIPEENNIYNNSKEFNVEILKNNRSINLISGALSPNTSVIKSILNKIPRVNIEHSIRAGKIWKNKWSNVSITKTKLIILDGFPLTKNDNKDLISMLNKNIPILFFSSPNDNFLTNQFLNSYFNISSNRIENTTLSIKQGDFFINTEKYPKQKLNYSRNCQNSILTFEDSSSCISQIQENLFIFIPNLSELNLKLSNINEENHVNDYIIKYLYESINNDNQKIVISSEKSEIILGEQIFLDIDINNELIDSIEQSGIQIISEKERFIETFSSKNNKYKFNPDSFGSYDIKSFYVYNNLDTVWSKSINISVLKLYPEVMVKSLNEIELRNLAKNSGGMYSHYSNYLNLINTLNFTEQNRVIKKSASTLNYQRYWIVIAFLLILEWLLRKKNGLL